MPFWLWLTASPAAAADTLLERVCASWPDGAHADSAAEALAHAETYYWWARSTGNSVEMHCYALRAFDDVAAIPADDADESARTIAAAGREQVRWRVDNSFDTFRNVYPLAWWMLGADPVVEPEDGPGALPDFYSHAVDHAWGSMSSVLDDPERPRTLAVIRCRGDAENCDGLRDFMSVLADAHPRLATIPDDRGVDFVGAGPWASLTGGRPRTPAIERGAAVALGVRTGFDELVVLDLEVADVVSVPVDGVRVELAADAWSLPSGERRRLAAGTGVGADLVPRRNLDLAWMGVVALLGVMLSPIRQIARPPSMEAESSGLSVGQVIGGLLLGAALGVFSLRLTGRLAPGMEELALNPAGLPRLATLQWPLAHGALLLVGPLIASIFLVFGAMPRVNAALAERLDLGLLTLSIQCGALALALAPIPAGEGLWGLVACAAMAAPAIAIAAILGERIEQIRGLIEVDPNRQIVPIVLAVAALLCAFPVMLAGTPPLAMFLVGAGLAVLVGFLGRPRRRQQPRTAAPDAAPVLGAEGVQGSLRRPAYVSLDGRDISPVLNWLSRPGVSVVSVAGGAGLGKSRLSEEIGRALPPAWKIGRSEAEDPQLSEGCVVPYAAVGTSLGAIFDQERVELAQIYARQVAVRELAASASDALDFLPGVGLLLGMGGGVDSEQLTLERLRRDIVRAIRRRLREQPVLLVIDDLQWADPSSLSLLEHVLVELSHLSAESLGHSVGVLLLHRPSDNQAIEGWIERLSARVAVLSVGLEPLSGAGVEALLRGAGVRTGSSDFAGAVRRQVGGIPLNILSLMHELVELGLGQPEQVDGGQQISIPMDLDEERLQAVVPTQMADLARQRLNRLRAEELLLLQGAAQCGRRFDATSLSNGFGLPRIEVLRRLRDIEDNHELITDLDDDDHFRFDTEVTRSVLIEMTTKRRGHGQRELVKEFHHRVVGALMAAAGSEQWNEEADAARVVRHALNAGMRRAGVAARFAVRAAASAARRFAYTEALRFVEVACEPTRQSRLTEAEAARLAEVEARIRRAVGGRDNRQIAIRRFASLLGSPHVDPLALARDWFEAIFEEKKPADLTQLAEAIETVREAQSARRADPLVEAVCDFYEVLNQTWLDGLRPPDAAVATSLARQAARLRDLDDARTPERERLLSWVLQAQATWTSDGDEVVRLCQESLLLKERHNDLDGQALTKGVLANHYLFKRREPARARTLLEEDLEILERMGARAQRSSVLNRLAMSDWLEAEQADDARQAARLQSRALSNARRAYDAAVQAGRPVDLIFAAFAVLSYGCALEQAELVSAVGAALVGRPDGWPWPDPDTLWASVPAWLKASKHTELQALRERLSALDGTDRWVDALDARLAPAASVADK